MNLNIFGAITYSLVIRVNTVTTIISIAITQGWSLRQLDVRNAFLNGYLNETMYMKQLVGFVDKKNPKQVCLLHKALYGLQQVHRAWYLQLQIFLIDNDFQNSQSNSSLFFKVTFDVKIHILVYVDDIIITKNIESHVADCFHLIYKKNSCSDLGKLNVFLGMECVR